MLSFDSYPLVNIYLFILWWYLHDGVVYSSKFNIGYRKIFLLLFSFSVIELAMKYTIHSYTQRKMHIIINTFSSNSIYLFIYFPYLKFELNVYVFYRQNAFKKKHSIGSFSSMHAHVCMCVRKFVCTASQVCG